MQVTSHDFGKKLYREYIRSRNRAYDNEGKIDFAGERKLRFPSALPSVFRAPCVFVASFPKISLKFSRERESGRD